MMTETLMAVEPHEEGKAAPAALVSDQPPRLEHPGGGQVAEPVVLSRQEAELLRGLVRRTRGAGGDLTGPDGLLKHLTKTVVTDNCGEVTIAVPRDRDGSFEPVIVAKRQRRLSDLDTLVISLYAKGLTTGEISAHLFEVYGANVSRDTVSRITDKIVEEMQAWWARPLERVYAAIFIDAIVVKVRDGQVANQPFYAAIGVDLDGQGHPRDLGRRQRRRRVSQVLAQRAHRTPQPRRAGRVLPRVRRAEGTPGQCRSGVPEGDRADLHHPPDPQHVPVRLT